MADPRLPVVTARHPRWALPIGLAAVILTVLAIGLWPGGEGGPVAVALADPDCDLHTGPCTARFSDGAAVTLEIAPRGLPLARPLRLRVATRGLQASAVAIDFVGTDMYMGYNRPVLAPDGAGAFSGEGSLAVCIRKHMRWEARVLLTTPAGLLVAPFRFETRR